MAQTTQDHQESREEHQESSQEDRKGSSHERPDSAQEHLLNHLRDAHAVELQALRQLARAADGSDGEDREIYTKHHEQTEAHEQKIKELVEAQGHTPSVVEDKTLRGGAIGLRQLAGLPLDTPAQLAMNLFALEHLEIATYEFLVEIARAAGDDAVAEAAEQILEEERDAAEKVAGLFDRVVDQLGGQGQSEDGSDEQSADSLLLGHLCDVHAIEQQSLQLLGIAAKDLCHDDELEQVYRDHLEQTEEQEKLVHERIEAHDAKPSAVKDLHMSTAKAGLHDLLKDPPDAAVKLAMNLYCVEHLEVAAYELLLRLAKQANDSETAEAAEKILEQEREAAEAVHGTFSRSVELMLQSDGSYEQVRAGERPQGQEDEDLPQEQEDAD